jgi:hypothetical protein
LNPDSYSRFDKVLPIVRTDNTTTNGKKEQATELLKTFFLALLERIDDEPIQEQHALVGFVQLTMQEIERKIFDAKAGRALGNDGLLAEVWKQLWLAVKERVLYLFRTSITEGKLPSQWKNAKIIPLKKPGKDNYTKAKNWRPISLLPTLGKVLESVIAERISFAVETYGLLPQNHFGARKQRSTEQALIVLQEQVYKAWRAGKVLSLVSFDVKGAYNGVYKERLL